MLFSWLAKKRLVKNFLLILYQIEGTVLGVEDVTSADGISRPFVHILVGTGTMRHVNLLEITEISIVDESVKKDLEHALDVYLSEKKKDMKKLTIFSQGGEKVTFTMCLLTSLEESSYC